MLIFDSDNKSSPTNFKCQWDNIKDDLSTCSRRKDGQDEELNIGSHLTGVNILHLPNRLKTQTEAIFQTPFVRWLMSC